MASEKESTKASQVAGKFSEDEILKLLDRIQERTGVDNALVFRYRFHSLFPEQRIFENDKFSIRDGYMKLRQHKEYYRYALSLVIFLVEGYGSKEEIDSLMEHVKSSTLFESDIRSASLNLWRMLTNIAIELNKGDGHVRSLVNMVGKDLDINTDHIAINGEHTLAAALRAFQKLEEKGKLKPMLEDQPEELKQYLYLYQLLKRMYKMKLIENNVKPFNPHQPITLALQDIKRLHAPPSVDSKAMKQEKGLILYRESLTATYERMSVIESNQWPPVKEHFYINLALITSEFIPRSDSFSRATIRGSVDDIYKRKEPIGFDQVFPKELSSVKHYVSLIEGRPGCGKSTLITKVSKDWAGEKILTDQELFILVRLRRFVGRKDLTLRDILGTYCPDPDVVEVVHDKMVANSGKGVCFAFDGLDEYSANLTPENIVMQLINGHILPLAAVYLTSRPATSEKFKHKAILSNNVEIIGFFEEQIEEYIRASYKDDDDGEVKATRLIKYVKDHPNVERMCYLPLHIAMVVYLYDLDKRGNLLPNTETELYHKFTLHTLFRACKKDLPDDAEEDDLEVHEFSDLSGEKDKIFKQVCKLAFMATVKQKQIFTGREIKKLAHLPEVPRKRDFDSVGLLTVDRMIAESSLPTKTFSFLHLTHQEFLAAVHLVDHLSDTEQLTAIQELAGEVHMWVVWKFYCGMCAINSKANEESLHTNSAYRQSFDAIIAANVNARLAILNMIHCAFESQHQVSCSALLALLNGVVNLQDIALNPSDCSALGFALSQAHQEVKQIDFSYCHLGPAGIAAFVQQLESSDKQLTEVNMLRLRARTDYNPVGTEGAHDLMRLLRKLPNLGELRLYGNKLKTSRFEHLAPEIAKLTKIHTLILSRNDLEMGTGPMVSNILANLPLLHTFYISYNPLTEEGLGSMKPGLLKCSQLKILGLRGTHLGEGAGAHLSEVLSTLTKLEWIELYQNQLGDKGICDMVPGLLQAQSLRKLSLVENGISDIGAKALTQYLSTTNTLTEMRIYYNHEMTDVGKIALRTAVVDRPKSLCYLGFAV